eukprot:CAMPEP_0201562180 /NCGR_PEP_ID=MMETSP0173_2-20130828/79189_1 /ASSEMBLY_ACC=CAM_ASM_000268 /TAXON_ID=218659 /ORGANISM="Vexillifera sp., Strain DIVA3 564/2" /LENGTH=345 /DNA_ID=CAMNT_0047976723 /DNA_START=382 /DNA_END=1415 /DNA_ORIENTATION=+
MSNDGTLDVEAQQLYMRLTLDAITEIGFGYKMNSIDQQHPFAKAFDAAQQTTIVRFQLPWIRALPKGSLRRYLFESERTLHSSVTLIDSVVQEIIDLRRRKGNHLSSSSSSDDEKPVDLLSRYFDLEKEDPTLKFSDQHLCDFIKNALVAGRDTTATSLLWLTFSLATNPTVYEKLSALVKEKFPDPNYHPNYDEIIGFTYLRAVIDEVLRLYPAVAIDPKQYVGEKPLDLPNGMKLQPGTVLMWCAYAQGRNPDVWDAPDEFRPERWIDFDKYNGGKQLDSPWRYTPFQKGRRQCLGIQFAKVEIGLVVTRLLQNNIRFEYKHKAMPRYQTLVTLNAPDGVPIT